MLRDSPMFKYSSFKVYVIGYSAAFCTGMAIVFLLYLNVNRVHTVNHSFIHWSSLLGWWITIVLAMIFVGWNYVILRRQRKILAAREKELDIDIRRERKILAALKEELGLNTSKN